MTFQLALSAEVPVLTTALPAFTPSLCLYACEPAPNQAPLWPLPHLLPLPLHLGWDDPKSGKEVFMDSMQSAEKGLVRHPLTLAA